MNATVEHVPAAAAPAPARKTHKFALLLKREFWEHRGGFFWAPVIASAISIGLSVIALIVGEVLAARHAIPMADGGNYSTSELIARVSQEMAAGNIEEAGVIVDVVSFMSASWPMLILAFVVFFYCLGALYDERKDRSVLFWKSLPVSDRDTVLSKLVSAVVIAPTLAVLITIATLFVFMSIASVVVLVHGGNPVAMIWGPGSPLATSAKLLASIPVYAIWALPSVGYLLLCSVWFRSKPFVWAILMPVLSGVLVTMFGVMRAFDTDTIWYWKHIVGRLLLSVVPGSNLVYSGYDLENAFERSGNGLQTLLSPEVAYHAFTTPDLWIGAAAGAAMIFAAIRIRRWRDEG